MDTKDKVPVNNGATPIKHIVYLMLENRSLDNVLGWLYSDGQSPSPNVIYLPTKVIAPPGGVSEYYGLREKAYYNLDSNGDKQWVTRGTGDDWYPLFVPEDDPYEDYLHINNQLFESEANPAFGELPTMGGFYKDFTSVISLKPWQIMQTYTPIQLAVLNGAALNWAVSDAYFSSVPTQTNCNRAFAATGNSIAPHPSNESQLVGWVNNNMGGLDPYKNNLVFNQRTMFNVLYDAGKQSTDDWMIFAAEPWENGYCFTRDILSQLHDKKYDSHFDSIEAFFYRAAKKDGLPSVCFLEPKWGYGLNDNLGVQGTDYHPPMNVARGEDFVATILNALQSSPNWNEILFIINFDEHGGTYDHVPPPWIGKAAVPWGGDSATPTPASCEHDFGFDRFGVRVPLILVSPYIDKNTVFRADGKTPYDHTSVIATILKMMGVPKDTWQLGNRVDNAPTFEEVLTRTTPRTDKIDFQPSAAAKATINSGLKMDPPPSDLQREIAFRVMRHHLKQGKTLDEKSFLDIGAQLADAKTISGLRKALAEATGKKVV